MSNFKALIFEKVNSIAYITLNRPKALNAYNIQMRDDLFQVLGAVKDDEEIKVAVLRGAGKKAFCAGADLSEFLTAPGPTEARRIRFERDVWGLFLSIPQPLIAAIHGYVLGSGIEMALCCDIRIAADDARFGLPEVGLGIIPAAGGTQTLPRTIGSGKALEMMLIDKWLSGEEAYQFGLVDRMVPADELAVRTREAAEKIASLDATTIRTAKQAVMRGLDLPLKEGLDLERRLAARTLLYPNWV